MARKPLRRTEYVDPNPIALEIKFQRPPTLAEQVARFMGDHKRWEAQQGFESPDEADDFEMGEPDELYSPHELVYDELLNREIPRYEKEMLDVGRKQFDEQLQSRIRQDQIAAKQARIAAAAQRKKDAEKNESPDGDDE